ncbi:hypothetical protein EK904_002702 [Melospiza melodia maxima]|nr:hypothetical protein EK904_002702 [Melospiza melodia maxima]
MGHCPIVHAALHKWLDRAVSDSEASPWDTLGQREGRCHFRLFHKVSLQVEDAESGRNCGGVVEMCQITEFKMLPFFVVHSKEANSAQDLAALAGLC